VHEQQRLKNIVEAKKDFGNPNFSKEHLKRLIQDDVLARMDAEEGKIREKVKLNLNLDL
jgi:hypothetical protein